MMTMMESITLSFEYCELDYVRAMRAHYSSRLRLPLDVTVAAGVAFFGAYELWSGSVIWGAAALSVAAIFMGMLVAALTVIPRVAFRRDTTLHKPYCLTFFSEGIYFQTSGVDSHLEWTLSTAALVNRDSFILYYGERRFTILPKRVFKDVDEQVRFKRLLEQKVSNVSIKD